MRQKSRLVLCVLAVWLVSYTITVHADADANAEKLSLTPVTEQIYVIAGKGGNVGIFTGDDGTFLIDDNFAPLTGKIIEAIKSIGGDHPKFLINTHYHGDHTGGNENLGKAGTLIFSHDNVRERLRNGSFIEAFNMKSEAIGPEGLPVVTFSEGINFHLNDDTIQAIHVAHAHTDGDSFVYFHKANVIHAGDIFFNGFFLFIDVHHGGSLKGNVQAVDKILSLADADTKIIPGHGPVGDKAQLASYRTILQELSENALSPKPLEDLETTWGDGLFTGDRWIELIYVGV